MKRDALYRVYDHLQRRIAPTLRYSQYLYEDKLRDSIQKHICWLDLGCGHHVLPLWREEQERDLIRKARMVVGLDADRAALLKHRSIRFRVCGNITSLPFADDSFDLVSANMVVEHLDKPEVQFHEVYRVLRPGGLFVFHTPNAYGYTTLFARVVPELLKSRLIWILDGRSSDDVYRTHYRANTASQIRRLAQETHLEVRDIRFIASSAKFAVVAPLAFVELFWIRLLMTRPFRRLRTNLIVALAKPEASTARL
jgi:SAM-dependent methyltransferase